MSNVICNQSVTGTLTVSGLVTLSQDINMTDGEMLMWGGNSILTHSGSATTIGDNSSGSVISIASGNSTFAGNIYMTGAGHFGAADNLYIGGATPATDHTFIGDSGRNVTIYNGATFAVASGASTFGGAVTVGVDDTGYDVKFFGATAGSYMLWDESQDSLILTDNSYLRIGDNNDLYIFHDGTDSKIQANNGDLVLQTNDDNTDITFNSDDGSGGVTEYFRVDGGNEQVQFSKEIKVIDDVKIKIGSGGDIQLSHNGTNSFINNNTGNITFTQNTDDGDIIFKSDDGSGGTATYFKVDGGAEQTTFSKNTEHQDDVQAQFGTSSDLKIYHSAGASSYIENGSGDFYIMQRTNDGDMVFQCDDGSGGDATYFKLDGGNEDIDFSKPPHLLDSVTLKIGSASGGDLQLYHNGSHSLISNQTGNLYLRNQTDDGIIYIQADDGSGGDTTYIKVDGSQSITEFPVSTKHMDSVHAIFGSSSDASTYHNGTDTWYFLQQADNGYIDIRNDDGSGGTTSYLVIDGNSELNRFYKRVQLEDNVKLTLGNITTPDLEIYHDGTESSYIKAVAGDLYIRSEADDQQIYIQGDDGSGGVANYLTIDGNLGYTLAGKDIRFNDSIKARFGTGLDAYIQHNGTNTEIVNATGNLNITNSTDDGDIGFYCDDGSGGNTEYFRLDGGIESLVVNKDLLMAIDGNGGKIKFGASQDLQIYHDATNSYITNGTGNLYLDVTGSDDMIFRFKSNDTAMTIDGGATSIITSVALQANSTITVGADDTGYDVKFFGATTGKYMLWDESADRLEIVGDMSITSDGSNDVVLSESGTGNFTIDAPGDINLDADGEQINFKHAGSTIVTLNVDSTPELDVTGDFTIDGTGDVTIIPADDLILSAGGDTEFARLQHAPTGGDSVKFSVKASFLDSVGCHFGTGASSDGDASILHDGSNWYFDTNTGDIILDAAGDQIRFKDGGSERIVFNLDSTPEMDVTGNFKIDCSGDITLDAAGDQIYMQDSGTTAFTFNCDSTPQLDVARGHFTIDIVNSDCDFILKGEDGMSAITALTVDMSEAGKATFNNDVVAFSDRKLKKDIKTLDGSKVYDMRGVSFTRIDTDNPGAGVIAQEMQEVAPELVTETNDTLGVSYGNLTGYLIEAIKDLKAEVEELKKQVKNGSTK